MLSARRRKILLLVAAAGVTGYASYKVCRSSFVGRKRRRIASLMSSLAQMIEAFAMGVDSSSIIAGDFRDFLLSDDDDVPRSLRQSLKIARCREFQDALAVFSSCVSRGVLRGITDRSSGIWLEEISSARRRNTRQSSDSVNSSRAYDRPRDFFPRFQSGDACESSVEPSSFKQEEQLPERLLQKLFSESGKGFASAVLGSVARTTVLSILEGLQSRSRGRDWELRGLAPDVSPRRLEEQHPVLEVSETLLDLCSSSRGRAFVAACVQAFVGTAVTVYLEKTKDVNLYEEMVAGMTKPGHQPAVKELLTSACSSAVETFVRTSHDVLSRSTPPEVKSQRDFARESVEELVKSVDTLSKNFHPAAATAAAVEDEDVVENLDETVEAPNSLERLQKTGTSNEISRMTALPVWVDGISRTLAVPSNRKLLIDVAGAVTSEAIHTFFEVFLGVVSPYLRGTLCGGIGLRSKIKDQNHNFTEIENEGECSSDKSSRVWRIAAAFSVVSKELVARMLVVMTVCLAIALHVFSDAPLIYQRN